MEIKFKCSKCLKVLTVRGEDAGRKTKCPGCGTFLRIPKPPVKVKKGAGDTALHVAAAKGDAKEVERLLGEGAGVNATNKDGRTPLHVAANEAVAVLLLQKGAEVNARSNNGETPLHVASGAGRKEVGAELLDKGADVNARTNAGRTPLHDAAMGAHPEVVKHLVKNGADQKIKAANGWTALDIAKWGVSAGDNTAYEKVLDALSIKG